MVNKRLTISGMSVVVLFFSAHLYIETRKRERNELAKDFQIVALALTTYVQQQGAFPAKAKWWESIFEKQPQLKRLLLSQQFPTRTAGGTQYTFTLNAALRGHRVTQNTAAAYILMLYLAPSGNGWGTPLANTITFPRVSLFKEEPRFVGMASGETRQVDSEPILNAIIASSKSEEATLPKFQISTGKKSQ